MKAMRNSPEDFHSNDSSPQGSLISHNMAALINQLSEMLGAQPVLTAGIKERIGEEAYRLAQQGVDLSRQPTEAGASNRQEGSLSADVHNELTFEELVRRNLEVLQEEYADEHAADDPFLRAPGVMDDLMETAQDFADEGIDLSNASDSDSDEDDDVDITR